MSISSLSFSYTSISTTTVSAPQRATPTGMTECCAPAAPTESERPGTQRAGGGASRLVQAMMTALRELGFGAPAATAPAASTGSVTGVPASASAVTGAASTTVPTSAPAADAAAPASTDPATLSAAVDQFAHELFQALRQGVGHRDSGHQADDRVEGGHGHPHRQHEAQRHAYGNLSQRLEALSQTFAAPVPAAAVGEAPAVAPSAVVSPAPNGANAPTASSAVPAAAPASSAASPLLDAFTKLVNALKSPASAAVNSTDMAGKLQSFLHALAQALQPDSAGGARAAPQIGGLMNVTA